MAVTLHARLPRELRKKLEAYARAQRINLSGAARVLLEAGLAHPPRIDQVSRDEGRREAYADFQRRLHGGGSPGPMKSRP